MKNISYNKDVNNKSNNKNLKDMVHSFFSIQFTNGKSFTLLNVTDDEIRSALRESYPNWSDSAIEAQVSNSKNYEKPKFYIGSVDEVRKQIATRGTSLNALNRLAKSYAAYYNNGYKQWGNSGKKVINTLSWEFLTFSNAMERYKSATSEKQIGNAIVDLVKALNLLSSATYSKGVDKFKFDKAECLEGRSRRLGIVELAERVPIILNEIKVAA